ncbi:hypothetical protein [Sphingobacterium paucimobilis]|uniref:Lipoprotein n=1 Tax=Sphingobacterium paucimobilis HER1398 TaxID=1346330 RepID=U2HAF0_9SPHI|nr:hypothetical protein [Sphingobacterium paucimobilis]ERJ58716.1 hypothetical protein M472_08040 [Sphingobacterium paucimobilis HER1398]
MNKYWYFILLLSLTSAACHEKGNNYQNETYVYNDGRDTIAVALSLMDNVFHGSYEKNSPGGVVVTGDISGNIKGDTLLGSLYYTPYKGRNKQRKAFALLKQNNDYIIGNGTGYIYMGIPYFSVETLTFDGQILKGTKK